MRKPFLNARVVVSTLFTIRFRAKREQLERLQGLSPAIQGQDLVLTVLHVPQSPDSGHYCRYFSTTEDGAASC